MYLQKQASEACFIIKLMMVLENPRYKVIGTYILAPQTQDDDEVDCSIRSIVRSFVGCLVGRFGIDDDDERNEQMIFCYYQDENRMV